MQVTFYDENEETNLCSVELDILPEVGKIFTYEGLTGTAMNGRLYKTYRVKEHEWSISDISSPHIRVDITVEEIKRP